MLELLLECLIVLMLECLIVLMLELLLDCVIRHVDIFHS